MLFLYITLYSTMLKLLNHLHFSHMCFISKIFTIFVDDDHTNALNQKANSFIEHVCSIRMLFVNFDFTYIAQHPRTYFTCTSYNRHTLICKEKCNFPAFRYNDTGLPFRLKKEEVSLRFIHIVALLYGFFYNILLNLCESNWNFVPFIFHFASFRFNYYHRKYPLIHHKLNFNLKFIVSNKYIKIAGKLFIELALTAF